MTTTVLIMAGGQGERFWPKSRAKLPKQFLALTDQNKTMLQLTVERILPLVGMENVFVATSRAYAEIVAEQLPALPRSNILCEPVGRNTAPCIALGAAYIQKQYGGDALMFVLPSDHLIQDSGVFLDVLKRAGDFAGNGPRLVTIGIRPDAPETGYGYIEYQKQEGDAQPFAVRRFVEKPDLETAKQYLASGAFLWNSGMFVWKVSTLLDNIRAFLPDISAGLGRIQAAIGTPQEEAVLEREFCRFPSISIDYGVMEKAEGIWVFPGQFGWDDVGSWKAVYRLAEKDGDENVLRGNVVAVNTHHSLVNGREKLIAVVGLDHVIVVDTEDALLICSDTSAKDIKTLLRELKEKEGTAYC